MHPESRQRASRLLLSRLLFARHLLLCWFFTEAGRKRKTRFGVSGLSGLLAYLARGEPVHAHTETNCFRLTNYMQKYETDRLPRGST